jgi:hypothetical protein
MSQFSPFHRARGCHVIATQTPGQRCARCRDTSLCACDGPWSTSVSLEANRQRRRSLHHVWCRTDRAVRERGRTSRRCTCIPPDARLCVGAHGDQHRGAKKCDDRRHAPCVHRGNPRRREWLEARCDRRPGSRTCGGQLDGQKTPRARPTGPRGRTTPGPVAQSTLRRRSCRFKIRCAMPVLLAEGSDSRARASAAARRSFFLPLAAAIRFGIERPLTPAAE